MTSVLGPIPILEPLTRDELYLHFDLALEYDLIAKVILDALIFARVFPDFRNIFCQLAS